MRCYHREGSWEGVETIEREWSTMFDIPHHQLETTNPVQTATPPEFEIRMEAGSQHAFFFHRRDSCGIFFVSSGSELQLRNDDLQLLPGPYVSNTEPFSSANSNVRSPFISLYYEIHEADLPLSDVFSPESLISASVLDVLHRQLAQFTKTAKSRAKGSGNGPALALQKMNSKLNETRAQAAELGSTTRNWAVKNRSLQQNRTKEGKAQSAPVVLTPLSKTGLEMGLKTILMLISSMSRKDPALLNDVLTMCGSVLETHLSDLVATATEIPPDIVPLIETLTSFLTVSCSESTMARSMALGLTLARGSLAAIISQIRQMWEQPQAEYFLGNFVARLSKYNAIPEAENDQKLEEKYSHLRNKAIGTMPASPGSTLAKPGACHLLNELDRISWVFPSAAKAFRPLCTELTEKLFVALQALIQVLTKEYQAQTSWGGDAAQISGALECCLRISFMQFRTMKNLSLFEEAGCRNEVLTQNWREMLYRLKEITHISSERPPPPPAPSSPSPSPPPEQLSSRACATKIRALASQILEDGWEFLFASTSSKLEKFKMLLEDQASDSNVESLVTAQAWFIRTMLLNSSLHDDKDAIVPRCGGQWLEIVTLQLRVLRERTAKSGSLSTFGSIINVSTQDPTDQWLKALPLDDRAVYLLVACQQVVIQLTMEELTPGSDEKKGEDAEIKTPVFAVFSQYASFLLTQFADGLLPSYLYICLLRPLLEALCALPRSVAAFGIIGAALKCRQKLHALVELGESQAQGAEPAFNEPRSRAPLRFGTEEKTLPTPRSDEKEEVKREEKRKDEITVKVLRTFSFLAHHVCGMLALGLLTGEPSSPVEVHNRGWLVSPLLASGKSKLAAEDLLSPDLEQILGSETEAKTMPEIDTFLFAVAADTEDGKTLVDFLSQADPLPKANAAKLGRQALCAVLAVVLKHSGHVNEAMTLVEKCNKANRRASFSVIASSQLRTTFKNTASIIVHEVGAIAGQGEDATAFVSTICARANFLLQFRTNPALRVVQDKPKDTSMDEDADDGPRPSLVRLRSVEMRTLKALMDLRTTVAAPQEDLDGASQLRRDVIAFVYCGAKPDSHADRKSVV